MVSGSLLWYLRLSGYHAVSMVDNRADTNVNKIKLQEFIYRMLLAFVIIALVIMLLSCASLWWYM